MFTGIIQSTGTILEAKQLGEDLHLRIDLHHLGAEDILIGDSIAVNGVCLTVTQLENNAFRAYVSQETLSKTSGFNEAAVGRAVNLEKALRFNDRLGGHLVSGHVDGIGKVVEFTSLGDCWKLVIEAPKALSKFIAAKGSICVHGVSLTVNELNRTVFNINLIPHTLENTNLQFLKVGDAVNLEIDLIARYVERMTEWQQENETHD
jgi:riboflavin synthase